MKTVKEKTTVRVLQPRYYPVLFLLLFETVLHLMLPSGGGDDAYFAEVLNKMSWGSFTVSRYMEWSSRVIIESVLIIVARFPLLWKAADIAVIVWIQTSLSKLFNRTDSQLVSWFIVFCLLAFPFETMASAGWIATTTNYLWPFACGLAVFARFKIIMERGREQYTDWLVILPCLIYAVNQEQMCIVMLSGCAFMTVTQYLKRKPVFSCFLTAFCISVISLVFILACPGNALRSAAETEVHFPEFSSMKITDKFSLGFVFSFLSFLTSPDCVYLIFMVFLSAAVYSEYGKGTEFLWALYPLMINLIFSVILPLTAGNSTLYQLINNGLCQTGPTSVWPGLLILSVLLCVCLLIWKIFKEKTDAILIIFVLGVGYATKMMMGFSPTIWISGTRTSFFLYFAMITASIFLFARTIQNTEDRKKIYVLIFILAVPVFLHWAQLAAMM